MDENPDESPQVSQSIVDTGMAKFVSPRARMSLTLGLLSIGGFFVLAPMGYVALCPLVVIPALGAIVRGFAACNDIRREPATYGILRAAAGILLGAIGTVLAGIALLLALPLGNK